MKLELKHLSPYLPYDLKCRTKVQDGTNKNLVLSLNGLLNGYARFNHRGDWSNQELDEIKPILRPLTDISKFKEKIKEEFYADINYSNNSICFDFDGAGIVTMNLLAEPLEALSFLFENHFDVFGLIEKGLAVDINTIKK